MEKFPLSFLHNLDKTGFLKVLGLLIIIQSILLGYTFIVILDTPPNLYNQYGIISDRVLIHFLENPVNKSHDVMLSDTTLVGTTLYSLIANGSCRYGSIALLEIEFTDDFTDIAHQEFYDTPLTNDKYYYGLATNKSHFWVLELQRNQYNKTIEIDNQTLEVCYLRTNIIGFTRSGSIFANQTLLFEDVYTLSYLQELDDYMPYGLPVCPYYLPELERIQYWNGSLYILEGIYGLLQLNANSLEREHLKTMAFQNYGRYLVESNENIDIDDDGTLWAESNRWEWISDQALQASASSNIHRYDIASGARLEILEKNPRSLGNLTDYDFINSTYYPPSFIIGSSRLEIRRTGSFYMGKGNKIIKPLVVHGWLRSGNESDEEENVDLLLGFLVYSFDRIPLIYPWFHPLFWAGGISLCVALAVAVIVRDRNKIV